MASLKNHPGMWLRDDAAAAINALEDKHGVIVINSAGRTKAEQQELIDRWDRGGAANRPPYLYNPARPAEASNHVADGGIAVDVYNYTSDRAKLEEFGFQWYGPDDVVHYTFVGGGKGGPSQDTKNRQSWLNEARGEKLDVDGIQGDKTTAAIKRYQTFLGVKADGIWGPDTQKAHQKYYDKIKGAKPAASGSNPFGIPYCAGLQKIANLYGAGTAIDQKWGPKSAAGFAAFLRRNWGYSGNDVLGPVMWAAIARWLRSRWGYVGNDVPGPVMRAALQKAEAANYREL